MSAYDRTIDVGYVHVGGYRSVPIDSTTGVHDGQVWVCADNCPHPSHAAVPAASTYEEGPTP